MRERVGKQPTTHAGRNLPGCWDAGAFTLDLLSSEGASAAGVDLMQLPGVSHVDRLAYERLDGGQRSPDMTNGIWRTLLLRVRSKACAANISALERDLLLMPAYMPTIRNWQLSRVTSESAWTHVWQQEFARVDDLLGKYLMHPIHWGYVDRWFDPEFPEWTVEAIYHALCPLSASILTHAQPATKPT